MTGSRAILITGSAARLGAIIARHVSENGHTPVIHYNRSAEKAEALAQALGTVAIGGDLGAPGVPDHLIERAEEAIGRPLSGLVNSASIFEHDRAETVTAGAMERHYRINTIAPVLLAHHFAARAEAAGTEDPVIVNILDQKLFNLHPDHFSYTLSKAALETATTMMAQSLAPRVRVAGVAPGYTLPAPGESEETFQKKAAGANALQRRLDPVDIARTVQFVLDCRAITGQTLIAANGEHLVPTRGDISFKTGDD